MTHDKTLTRREDRRERGEIAELIRSRRKEKGLSLEDLERITGLSRSYLGELESGRKGSKMPGYTMTLLSSALSIAPHRLVGEADNNQLDARKYGEHYRVLRSNVRAAQVARLLRRIRTNVESLRNAYLHGADTTKTLQDIEKTVEAIDNALAYRGKPPVSVQAAADTGDDDKFFELEKSG